MMANSFELQIAFYFWFRGPTAKNHTPNQHNDEGLTMMMMMQSVSRAAIVRCSSRRAASVGGTTWHSFSSASTGSSSSSPWSAYDMAPLDPIIGLNEEFAKDPSPNKVIVGVGAYRDDAGKPYVLPCVREAERRLTAHNVDMEYSGIVCTRS